VDLAQLAACVLHDGAVVAEQDDLVAGVAGLRDAAPGPGAGTPGGRWLEACRLAVRPAHREGTVTRNLIGARVSPCQGICDSGRSDISEHAGDLLAGGFGQ
jgi:hypothetical protein